MLGCHPLCGEELVVLGEEAHSFPKLQSESPHFTRHPEMMSLATGLVRGKERKSGSVVGG